MGELPLLERLNASHNVLRPTTDCLMLPALKTLARLQLLDLSFNQKCGKQTLERMLGSELPLVDSRITLAPSFHNPAPEGAFEGDSAAERDATQLRPQLEPWSTTALRRRLVADFGQPVSDPATAGRADVMRQLLEQYKLEANSRRIVHVDGTLVDESLCRLLLAELQQWAETTKSSGLTRERFVRCAASSLQ